jgi:hypothetical protein
MRVTLLACVGLILFLGVFPGAAMGFAEASIGSLTALGGAIAAVLP